MRLDLIQKLVGNVKEEHLTHIDCYTGENFALFLPVTGQCGYAVKKNHTHPGYSFILCPNSIKISGEIIKKKAGSEMLVAMSPGFPHHEDTTEDFVRYFAVLVEKEYFESIYKMYSDTVPYYENSVFEVKTDLIPILKSYITEYRDRLPGYEKQLRSLEERIIHLIIRNTLNAKSSIESLSRRFEVESAIEYIHANYMNKMTVDEISNHVNYSASNFTRMFKKEIGFNISAYIVKVRLEKAKKLMEIGKDNLTEISYSCGFNSPSHFSAAYKKEYRVSPSAYKVFVGRCAEV